MKLQRDGYKPQEDSLEIKALCQTPSKAFDMFRATETVSPKYLKEDDQDSVRKARRPPQRGLDGSHTGDQREDCEVIDVSQYSC